jgi:hypothetical protein
VQDSAIATGCLLSNKEINMLSLRKHILQQQHQSLYRSCLFTRLFATATENEIKSQDLKPIKSIKDKNGVTEVYIIHRSQSGKGKNKLRKVKVPFSQRLKEIAGLTVEKKTDTEVKINQKWTKIPEDTKYERKKDLFRKSHR